jgi:hypothetical protein
MKIVLKTGVVKDVQVIYANRLIKKGEAKKFEAEKKKSKDKSDK